jgi:uncharacterized membrane protein
MPKKIHHHKTSYRPNPEHCGGQKECNMLRSARERAIQTLSYEAIGLLIILPCYAVVTGHAVADSVVLLVAVSIATMSWACLHNIAFDYVESRLTGRVASDRPQGLRLVHAASTEITSILVTTPVIVLAGGRPSWSMWD